MVSPRKYHNACGNAPQSAHAPLVVMKWSAGISP
jgi:hypothetical protein